MYFRNWGFWGSRAYGAKRLSFRDKVVARSEKCPKPRVRGTFEDLFLGEKSAGISPREDSGVRILPGTRSGETLEKEEP